MNEQGSQEPKNALLEFSLHQHLFAKALSQKSIDFLMTSIANTLWPK
jgi:hypothetical protein